MKEKIKKKGRERNGSTENVKNIEGKKKKPGINWEREEVTGLNCGRGTK